MREMKQSIIAVGLLWFTILSAQNLQKPAVAGYFYPADSVELKSILNRFYDRVSEYKIKGRIYALISPHAGYVYSGQVAAHGYKAIRDQKYDCVILIGPSHHHNRGCVIVNQKDGHETPLGVIPFDRKISSALLARKGIFSYQSEAFVREHSIEVQLPFLQTTSGLKDTKIIEILMVDQNLKTARALAQAIVENTKGRNVLIIASSDLSHYYPYKEAKRLDQKIMDNIKSLNEDQLYQDLQSNRCEACGGGPIMTAMIVARMMGADDVKILNYANSGDVTGDHSAVVGYLSAIIYKKEVGMDLGLNDSEKKLLRGIARRAVEMAVSNSSPNGQEVLNGFKEIPERLKEKRGVFVTLKIGGRLRGCIGRLIGDRPLCETTAEMAIAAATQDPRFRPLQKEEIKDVDIEISVLTPLKRIEKIDEIEVGRDGILIRQGIFSGVLLPQVATEYNWDRITFLEETCHKAGLHKDAWKDKNTEIYTFSAQVF